MLQRPAQRLGVATPERYEQLQRAIITNNREADRAGGRKSGPWNGDYRDPFEVPEAQNPPVYVGGGAWLVRCPCGDAPSVDPETRIARCCYCGRVFRQLVMPADADAIETVLLRRPHVLRMNWHPAETLDDLKQENIRYGVDDDPTATPIEQLGRDRVREEETVAAAAEAEIAGTVPAAITPAPGGES
jgi:hypothetical protein